MFRQHHISGNVESIPLSGALQSLLEDVAGSRRTQTRRTLVAAERKKEQTPRFLKSFEAPRNMPSYAEAKDEALD